MRDLFPYLSFFSLTEACQTLTSDKINRVIFKGKKQGCLYNVVLWLEKLKSIKKTNHIFKYQLVLMDLNYQNITCHCIFFAFLSMLELNGSKLNDSVQRSKARSWDTSVFLKNDKHIPKKILNKNLVASISQTEMKIDFSGTELNLDAKINTTLYNHLQSKE